MAKPRATNPTESRQRASSDSQLVGPEQKRKNQPVRRQSLYLCSTANILKSLQKCKSISTEEQDGAFGIIFQKQRSLEKSAFEVWPLLEAGKICEATEQPRSSLAINSTRRQLINHSQ